MKRPLLLWPLVILLILLSLGGFSGGIPMLADPHSGGYLDFGEIIPQLPVSNLVLPGLFLIGFMGIYPLLLALGLVLKPSWPWADRLCRWSSHHWAWTGTLALCFGIAVWLAYEAWLLGWWPITTMTAVLGGLILILALVPSVREFYLTPDLPR